MPSQFRAELVHAAREAFASSLRLTSVIAAVIVTGISIMPALTALQRQALRKALEELLQKLAERPHAPTLAHGGAVRKSANGTHLRRFWASELSKENTPSGSVLGAIPLGFATNILRAPTFSSHLMRRRRRHVGRG